VKPKTDTTDGITRAVLTKNDAYYQHLPCSGAGAADDDRV